jgi:hypothetical protein
MRIFLSATTDSPHPDRGFVTSGDQTMRRATFVLLALSLLSSSAVFADAPSPSQVAVSKFVQRFYDWYTPVAHKSSKSPAWIVALNKYRADFDSRLSRALRRDAEAQQRVTDDIVGLDFDPFLSGQDPEDKYTVGEVTETDGVYLVSVYGTRDGKRSAKPEVVVELKASKGALLITNFRYGADGDLLGTLKLLSDERAHSPQ